MADFASSTHKRSWVLKPDALQARRTEAHRLAVEHCSALNDATAMTPDEELELLTHHERRTAALARELKLPARVAATMVVYLKRFYADRSVMLYNPSVAALQALYTAAKVDEPGVHSEVLVNAADSFLNAHGGRGRQDPGELRGPSGDKTASRVSLDTLLAGELNFLQAIDFQLVVYHPYRSLHVVAELLAEASTPSDVTLRDKVLKQAHQLCSTRVLHSDLVLTQPPGVIAAGATLAACNELASDAHDAVLAALCASASGADADADAERRRKVIIDVASQIASMPSTSNTVERLAQLEAKRLAVRDVSMDATSEEYQLREAQVAEDDDKGRREAMKKMIDEEQEKANRLLLQENSSPRASKRSRTDAELDGDGDDSTRSPVRKRLSLY